MLQKGRVIEPRRRPASTRGVDEQPCKERSTKKRGGGREDGRPSKIEGSKRGEERSHIQRTASFGEEKTAIRKRKPGPQLIHSQATNGRGDSHPLKGVKNLAPEGVQSERDMKNVQNLKGPNQRTEANGGGGGKRDHQSNVVFK